MEVQTDRWVACRTKQFVAMVYSSHFILLEIKVFTFQILKNLLCGLNWGRLRLVCANILVAVNERENLLQSLLTSYSIILIHILCCISKVMTGNYVVFFCSVVIFWVFMYFYVCVCFIVYFSSWYFTLLDGITTTSGKSWCMHEQFSTRSVPQNHSIQRLLFCKCSCHCSLQAESYLIMDRLRNASPSISHNHILYVICFLKKI